MAPRSSVIRNSAAVSVVIAFRIAGCGHAGGLPHGQVVQHHVRARLAGHVHHDVGAKRHRDADAIRAAQAIDDRVAGRLGVAPRADAAVHRLQMLGGEVGADQHRALLLHQRQDGVRELKAVLDRLGAAEDGVARGLVARRVHGHGHPRGVRLGDGRLDLVHRIEIRVAVGDQLDRRRAVVDVLPDGLADFVWRVGVDVLELPVRALLGRDVAGLPAIRRDDLAGVEKRRPDEPPALDGAAHVDAGVVGVVADVLHHREAGPHHVLRAARAQQRAQRLALPDVRADVVQRAEREVRVRVHQPGHHPLAGQVDHRRARRHGHLRADVHDLAALDQDDLVPRDGAGGRVHEVPGADGGDLGERVSSSQTSSSATASAERRGATSCLHVLREKRHRPLPRQLRRLLVVARRRVVVEPVLRALDEQAAYDKETCDKYVGLT